MNVGINTGTPGQVLPGKHGARLVTLDALRGIAIALVVMHHVWWRFPSIHDDPVARFVAGIGWAGVDLFFGISGYLITTILLQASGRDGLRSFFIKRFFRIIPIYLVALAVFVVASLLTGNDREVLGRIWVNVFLLTAWCIPFVGENGVPFTITWSVSVEEFAYLFFGAMAAMGARFLTGSLRWVLFGALLIRIVSIVCFAFEPITLYYFAPGRIDAIAMGGVMATLPHAMRQRLMVAPWVPWGVWLVLVSLCSHLQRENPLVATLGYTGIAFASAWLVLCVVNGASATHWRITRWLASLGLVSYFVYLFHGFVIAGLSKALSAAAVSVAGIWGLSLSTVLLTYVLARMSWKCLEYPMILRGRLIADRGRLRNS